MHLADALADSMLHASTSDKLVDPLDNTLDDWRQVCFRSDGGFLVFFTRLFRAILEVLQVFFAIPGRFHLHSHLFVLRYD